MVWGGERDEGERKLAFEGVGDADDASLGDERVRGYSLFNGAFVFVS